MSIDFGTSHELRDRRDAELGERPAKARRRVAIVEAPGGARGAASALAEWIERHVIAHLEAAHAAYRPRPLRRPAHGRAPLAGVQRRARRRVPIHRYEGRSRRSAGGDLDQQFALARTGHRRFDKFDAGCGPGLGNRFHQFTSVMSSVIRPRAGRRQRRAEKEQIFALDSRVHVRRRLRSNDASALPR